MNPASGTISPRELYPVRAREDGEEGMGHDGKKSRKDGNAETEGASSSSGINSNANQDANNQDDQEDHDLSLIHI